MPRAQPLSQTQLPCSHAPAWEYREIFQKSECFIVLTSLRLITLPAIEMNAFKTSIQLSLRQELLQSPHLIKWIKPPYYL